MAAKKKQENAKSEEVEEKVETKTEEKEVEVKTEAQLLKEQLDEKNDLYLRLAAEYDNYRKRSQKEKDAAYTNSKANVLEELLPILDNFERAAANSEAPAEEYKKGIDMIFNQFSETLKKMGVESFGEPGDEFDPNQHSAVMHIDDDEQPENTIVEVFSKGYKLNDRILRFAVVKVAN